MNNEIAKTLFAIVVVFLIAMLGCIPVSVSLPDPVVTGNSVELCLNRISGK